MHENLKYNLKLHEGITAFETMNISDTPSAEEKAQIADWQPVFSETNYGTHYLIYAKFLGKKLDEGSFSVKKVQLYLQNFSGGVTIGLTGNMDFFQSAKDTEDPDFNDPRYPDRQKYKMQIGLQGMATNHVLKHFEPQKEIVLKTGDIIQAEAFFLPVDTGISKIFDPEDMGSCCFVDEIFMERNGDEIFVTSIGETRLAELASFEQIDRKLLSKLNIDPDKPGSGPSSREERGKYYPCQPRSSIVDIQ